MYYYCFLIFITFLVLLLLTILVIKCLDITETRIYNNLKGDKDYYQDYYFKNEADPYGNYYFKNNVYKDYKDEEKERIWAVSNFS